MALTALGKQAQTVVLKTESHKLHHEFTVKAGSSIKKGQPVKLHTDGTIEPLGVGVEEHISLGYALFSAEENEYVTIVMRGYAILFVQAFDAFDAGPVKYKDFGTGTIDSLPNYIGATDSSDSQGWALEAAASEGDP